MSQQDFSLASLFLASSGFLISLVTLYLTQFMGPKISLMVGPYIKLYHADFNNSEWSSGIYLPFCFFNQSVRSTIIKKIAIELYSKDNLQKRYFMYAQTFDEYNQELGMLVTKEMAPSLPLLGKTSVSKTGWYMWHSTNNEKLDFNEGIYILNFIYWIGYGDNPQIESHELVIDKQTSIELAQYRNQKKKTTVTILLDKEIEINRLLNIYESEHLLGK